MLPVKMAETARIDAMSACLTALAHVLMTPPEPPSVYTSGGCWPCEPVPASAPSDLRDAGRRRHRVPVPDAPGGGRGARAAPTIGPGVVIRFRIYSLPAWRTSGAPCSPRIRSASTAAPWRGRGPSLSVREAPERAFDPSNVAPALPSRSFATHEPRALVEPRAMKTDPRRRGGGPPAPLRRPTLHLFQRRLQRVDVRCIRQPMVSCDDNWNIGSRSPLRH